MKEQEYYNLLRDYNQMVRQKEFNRHSCNQSRMNKAKRALVRHLNKALDAVTKDLLIFEKHAAADVRCDSGHVVLISQRDSLIALKENINAERFLNQAEFENTYCDVKPSFVPAVIAATMVAGLIGLMAFFQIP